MFSWEELSLDKISAKVSIFFKRQIVIGSLSKSLFCLWSLYERDRLRAGLAGLR